MFPTRRSRGSIHRRVGEYPRNSARGMLGVGSRPRTGMVDGARGCGRGLQTRTEAQTRTWAADAVVGVGEGAGLTMRCA